MPSNRIILGLSIHRQEMVLRNENACIQMVGKLSLDDCGRLYSLIRKLGRQEAIGIVRKQVSNIEL